jgi:hypothetical protein
MNGKSYQEVLEEYMLPFMGIQCTHFPQDGVPCSASKLIKAFLAQKNFQVIDLSQIENCSNHMKNLLKKDTSSIPKLTEVTKELRTQELMIDYLQKLSDSMHRRRQMVIEAIGEVIILELIAAHFLCCSGPPFLVQLC